MTTKKKLLFVVQNATPFQSGRAKQALSIAEQLRLRGICVDVLSLDYESTSIQIEGVHYRRSIYHARSNYVFLIALCCIKRYHAVHFHGFNYLVGMSNVLRLLGMRCVLNMSCKSYDTPATLTSFAWLGKWQRRALKKLDYWIVQNKSDLHEEFHTVYLPNMVAMPKKLSPWQQREQVILNIGVICPRKGQLDVIKEFKNKPRLIQEGWKLMLCGSYSNDYEEYDKTYVDACLELAKNDSSICFTGHLNSDELSDLIGRSRCFTAMSKHEGLSNAYLECLAHGLRPIINADKHDDLFTELALVDASLHWHPDDNVDERFFDDNWNDAELVDAVRTRFSASAIVPRLITMYLHNKPSLRTERTSLKSAWINKWG